MRHVRDFIKILPFKEYLMANSLIIIRSIIYATNQRHLMNDINQYYYHNYADYYNDNIICTVLRITLLCEDNTMFWKLMFSEI